MAHEDEPHALEPLVLAEAPLKAFISGRIRPDLLPVRDAIEASLAGLRFVRAWRFERTPASSEELDESYLRHVPTSDFFIWVVDTQYSKAVANEVGLALEKHIPALVIVLPAAKRDAPLDELLDRVKPRMKLCLLQDEADLTLAVQLSLADELIRALRGVGTGRRQHLLRKGLESRGRMITKLQGTGLLRPQAIALADLPPVGGDPTGYFPSAEHPVRLVVADVGAGKSLIAELSLNQAIKDALDDPMAPVPLYSRATEVEGGLAEWVVRESTSIGDPSVVGAFVVLDGADEPGPRPPGRLIDDARALVNSFPSSRVLITSRPIPVLASAAERKDVDELSEAHVLELITRVTGPASAPRDLYGLDPSLRHALKRPLFALMYAVLLTREVTGRLRSGPDIVRALIEKILEGRSNLADLDDVAATLTREGRADFHPSEFGAFKDLQARLATGLLAQDGERIRFGLPILQEWFAAQYLTSHLLDRAAMLGTERLRDRWRAAIALCLEGLDRERADALMAWLVEVDPGFAAGLPVQSPYALREATPLERPAVAYGNEWQNAIASWTVSLGPLARQVFPVDAQGRPRTLAVRVDRGDLVYWRDATSVDPMTKDLAAEDRAKPGFVQHGHMQVQDWRGWAWAQTLGELQDGLAQLLSSGNLEVHGSSDYDKEMAWLLASVLTQRGSLDPRPIPIDAALKSRFAVLAGSDMVRTRGRGPLMPVRPLAEALKSAESEGGEELLSPWPVRDKEGGSWVWLPYSAERLLARTEGIYLAAMGIYHALVAEHFRPVAARLWHWRMFPATLVGVFTPTRGDKFEDQPLIDYYFEPLPDGAVPRIALTTGPRVLRDTEEARTALLREMRPDAIEFLDSYPHSSALDVYGHAPATKVAFSWLREDLRAINLLTTFGLPPDW